MGNLVPEKRMDINGKMVTRHVLPPAAPSSGVDIPAPPWQQLSMQNYETATAIADAFFTTEGYDIVAPDGSVISEYSFEEAVDALIDMFPRDVLSMMRKALKNNPSPRAVELMYGTVERHIYYGCTDKQEGRGDYAIPPMDVNSVCDGYAMAPFVADFSSSDGVPPEYWVLMARASYSIQRVCTGDKWEEILSGTDIRTRLLESQYVSTLITNSQLEYEDDIDPHELIRERLQMLEHVDTIRNNQGYFTQRCSLDIALINELEGAVSALHEGTL